MALGGAVTATESPYPWAARVARLDAREIIEMTCASVWAYEEAAFKDFWHVHLWTEDVAPCPHVVVLGGAAGGAFHRQRFDTWDEAEAWLREGS
jgi:hypothetical protein